MQAVEASITSLLERSDHAGAARVALEAYGPEILGYLVAVLKNEDDGRDAFADACEDMWRGLAGFRGDSSFRTWAYAIANHAAHRHARRPHRTRTRRITTSEISDLAAQVPSSTIPKLRSAAARLRQELPPEDQALLILRIDREMSWKDVGQVLSAAGERIEASTVRKRFERIKEQLAKAAAKQGLRGP